MKKILKFAKFLPVVLGGSLLVFTFLTAVSPQLAHAQSGSVQDGLKKIQQPFGSSAGLFSNDNVFDLIASIIKILLTFAGAVAVLFVIIGGFQYITSAGNAEAAEKGKSTVINAIIGVVVIVLSYVIINVIVNTVQCSTSGGGWFGGC